MWSSPAPISKSDTRTRQGRSLSLLRHSPRLLNGRRSEAPNARRAPLNASAGQMTSAVFLCLFSENGRRPLFSSMCRAERCRLIGGSPSVRQKWRIGKPIGKSCDRQIGKSYERQTLYVRIGACLNCATLSGATHACFFSCLRSDVEILFSIASDTDCMSAEVHIFLYRFVSFCMESGWSSLLFLKEISIALPSRGSARHMER